MSLIKVNIFGSIVLLAGVLWGTSCQSHSKINDINESEQVDTSDSKVGDSADDTDPDSKADTDSGVDTDSKADTDSGADTDSKADTDSGVDTDTNAPQAELNIIIRNNTDQVKYFFLHWCLNCPTPYYVLCADNDEGKCSLHPPHCMYECNEVVHIDLCDIHCAPMMAMIRVLKPGEEMTELWDGQLVKIDEKYCEYGSCYRKVNPPAGEYTLEIFVYDDYTCPSYAGPCEESGSFLNGAQVSGEYVKYTTTITLPTQEESVLMIVE